MEREDIEKIITCIEGYKFAILNQRFQKSDLSQELYEQVCEYLIKRADEADELIEKLKKSN